MNGRIKNGLITALAAGMLTACGDSDQEQEIARVGDEPITPKQFEHYLETKGVPKEDEERRQDHLKRYLEREALTRAIEKKGELDKGRIAAEVREYRKQMVISRYFEDYLDKQLTEDAVRNYYDNHSDEFTDQKIKVAHVLIRTNDQMSEAERKAKLTKAREARSKIQSGESFAKVAKAYSDDSNSAGSGGKLGWIEKGAISPRFSKKVFNLESGKVSEPFETPFGFHIVKVLDGPKEVRQSFQAVKGDIRYQLRKQAKEAERKALMEAVEIKRLDDANDDDEGDSS